MKRLLARTFLALKARVEWVIVLATAFLPAVLFLKFALPIVFDKQLEAILGQWLWPAFLGVLGLSAGYWFRRLSVEGEAWATKAIAHVLFIVDKGLNGQPVRLLSGTGEHRIERCQVDLEFLAAVLEPKIVLIVRGVDREKFRLDVKLNLGSIIHPGDRHTIVLFDREATLRHYDKPLLVDKSHPNALLQVSAPKGTVFDDLSLTFLPAQDTKRTDQFGVHFLELKVLHKGGTDRLLMKLNISDQHPTKTYLYGSPEGNVEFNKL